MNEKKNIGPETRTLATLLGELDAVFWPFAGNAEMRSIGATMELRKDWISGKGLPCRSHGTADERKDNELLWRRLADAGLITISANKGRRTHCKFTTNGESLVRCLCATGSIPIYWPVFAHVVRMFDRTGSSSLPESYTCCAEPWTESAKQVDRIYYQRCRLLPFITAGWLSLWHDCRGSQWIGLTEAGRSAITDGRPAMLDEEWGLIEEVSDIYEQAYRAETSRLATATPEDKTNLYPPASAGIGWGGFERHLELKRDRDERRANERLEVPS